MEERSVSVPLGEPGNPAPLAPILLLNHRKMGELVLQMVTKCPTLVIKTTPIRDHVKGLDARKDIGLQVAVFSS
jgi:hypothetical protein